MNPLNPLTASALLFGAAGVFQALIGTATAIYVAAGGAGRALFFTERSDAGAFGQSPAELIAHAPGIDTYRHVVWLALGGLLLGVGLLEAAVAWWGIRAGALWSLVTLTAVAAVMATFWVAILGVYVRHGAAVSLGDVPPFMWVTALLHVLAIVLGWWGILGGRAG